MSLNLDLVFIDERWQSAERLVETVQRVEDLMVSSLRLDGSNEAVILFTDDGQLASLNKEFRGKSGPTNVLSFPGDAIEAPDGSLHLGDIAISFDTVLKESIDQQKKFTDHALHMVVHGLLHLAGFDHESDNDADIMENLEISILAELAVKDPYIIIED